jgi:hypothetical protein
MLATNGDCSPRSAMNARASWIVAVVSGVPSHSLNRVTWLS